MAWDKEKSTKYKNTFIKETYDRINLTTPKGKKEVIKAHAESNGESLNGFINRAIENQIIIDKAMKNDNQTVKEE